MKKLNLGAITYALEIEDISLLMQFKNELEYSTYNQNYFRIRVC